MVFNQSQNAEFLIKYNPSNTPQENYTNALIREIGMASSKPFEAVNFQYTFTLIQKAIKTSNTGNRISVLLSNGNCKSSILVRGFDISKALTPDRIDLKVSITGQNSQALKTYVLTGIKIDKDNTELLNSSLKVSADVGNIKISADVQQFWHSKIAKEKVSYYLKLIDLYYSTETKFPEALAKLKAINVKNADMIQVYDIQLDEVEVILNELNGRNLTELLNLNKYDPLEYQKKLTSLTETANKLRIVINNSLANLDQELTNKAVELLRAGDTSKAITHLQKAIDYNYFCVPAQYYLSAVDLAKDSIDKAADRIAEIFVKLNPYPPTVKSLIDLSLHIQMKYVRDGKKLIKDEDYLKAINLFNRAEAHCKGLKATHCTDSIYWGQSEAYHGMYATYLRVAQKAVDIKKWDLAENYIRVAKEYQKTNSAFIKTPDEADALLAGVYNRYTTNAEMAFNVNDYENALKYYELAIAMCKSFDAKCSDIVYSGIQKTKYGMYKLSLQRAETFIKDGKLEEAEKQINISKKYQSDNTEIAKFNDADSLLGKIKVKFYASYIEEGKRFLELGIFQTAFEKLQLAKEIERTYLIKKNAELPELFRQAARPFIVGQINDAKFKVWANNLEEAKKIYTFISSLQQNNGLERDSLIDISLANLSQSILVQECNNNISDYEIHLYKGINYLKDKKYLYADDELGTAISIANKNPNCQIDSKKATDYIVKISPATQYQLMIKTAEQRMQISEFADFISIYNKAKILYDSLKVSSFEINHSPLHEFATRSSNTDLIYYMTKYYLKNNDIDKSLFMIKSLARLNYPVAKTKVLQKKIGKNLSIKDKQENVSKDLLLQSEKYTEGLTYLNTLKRSYLLNCGKFYPLEIVLSFF